MSIQVSLSGLSFFILESSSHTVIDVISEHFESKQTPQGLLNQLEHAFNSNDVLQTPFSKVQLIHNNNMQSLVPSALFDEAALSDYIKYNTKIFKIRLGFSSKLKRHDSLNLACGRACLFGDFQPYQLHFKKPSENQMIDLFRPPPRRHFVRFALYFHCFGARPFGAQLGIFEMIRLPP